MVVGGEGEMVVTSGSGCREGWWPEKRALGMAASELQLSCNSTCEHLISYVGLPVKVVQLQRRQQNIR